MMKRLFWLGAIGLSLTDLFSLAAGQQIPKPRVTFTEDQKKEQAKAILEAGERVRQAYADFRQRKDQVTAERSAAASAFQQLPDEQKPAPLQRALALASEVAFTEPEEIRSVNGVLHARLVVDYAVNKIPRPGGTEDRVRLRNYNGKLVGPTLRCKPGDTLRILLENRLTPDEPLSPDADINIMHGPNTTNLHTHGLHVSPAGNSDNVLLAINGGQRFEYEINIPEDHPAGTFWYHGHKHGAVGFQVSSGMAGALIVEGGMDELASIAAMTERLFVLQQVPHRPFTFPDGQTLGGVELKHEGDEGVQDIFGPTAWNNLGLFTTINGAAIPVVHMRPGEIQRWRFVMTGYHDNIKLRLAREGGDGGSLPLHLIALDGLPLGWIDTYDGESPERQLELWPGYRADVLVEAPGTGGVFLLSDETTPAEVSLNEVQQLGRKFLAKVVVAGEPVSTMTMPYEHELRRFRLPSLFESEVRGHQTAVYRIIAGPKFVIDDKPYDPSKPDQTRHLPVDTVEEWTIQSGGGTHPFHIHVNPFEVFFVADPANPEVNLLGRPIWRDTYAMPPNRVIKFRTQYRRYIGEFVQHCHILDHEDQGMMQTVVIDPPGGFQHGGAGHADAGPVAHRANDPHALVRPTPGGIVHGGSQPGPHGNR